MQFRKMDRVSIFLLALILTLGVSVQERNIPKHLLRSNDIQCFSCNDCKTVTNSTHTKICPPAPFVSPDCVAYAKQYKDVPEPRVIRGCASEIGTCKLINKAHEKFDAETTSLLGCQECSKDLCNFGSMIRSVPMVTAFCSMVILPVLKVYTV